MGLVSFGKFAQAAAVRAASAVSIHRIGIAHILPALHRAGTIGAALSQLVGDGPTPKLEAAAQIAFNDSYVRDLIDNAAGITEFDGAVPIARFFQPVVEIGRAVVFTCPHWGSYVRSFNLIGNSFPAGSRFIALRGNRWNDGEDRLWEQINARSSSEISIFRVFDERSLKALIRELRHGACAFILFDLFEDYGRTRAIKFFDGQLNITFRWIEIAYLANAVVTFVKPSSVERDHLEVQDVLDPNGFDDRDAFVHACLKSCSRTLEALILENSDFWFMWEHLDKYGYG